MKLRKKEDAELGIDMTPMIDCVFLLLIFFMCAATMSKVDLTPEIRLPIAPKSVVPEDMSGRGTVNILPLGAVTGSGETATEERPFMVGGRLLDDAGLRAAIAEKRKEDPRLRLNMRVDRNADFALVRRGIKASAEAGVFDIIFASFQSRSGE